MGGPRTRVCETKGEVCVDAVNGSCGWLFMEFCSSLSLQILHVREETAHDWFTRKVSKHVGGDEQAWCREETYLTTSGTFFGTLPLVSNKAEKRAK